jgi:hypothetical protein
LSGHFPSAVREHSTPGCADRIAAARISPLRSESRPTDSALRAVDAHPKHGVLLDPQALHGA